MLIVDDALKTGFFIHECDVEVLLIGVVIELADFTRNAQLVELKLIVNDVTHHLIKLGYAEFELLHDIGTVAWGWVRCERCYGYFSEIVTLISCEIRYVV